MKQLSTGTIKGNIKYNKLNCCTALKEVTPTVIGCRFNNLYNSVVILSSAVLCCNSSRTSSELITDFNCSDNENPNWPANRMALNDRSGSSINLNFDPCIYRSFLVSDVSSSEL